MHVRGRAQRGQEPATFFRVGQRSRPRQPRQRFVRLHPVAFVRSCAVIVIGFIRAEMNSSHALPHIMCFFVALIGAYRAFRKNHRVRACSRSRSSTSRALRSPCPRHASSRRTTASRASRSRQLKTSPHASFVHAGSRGCPKAQGRHGVVLSGRSRLHVCSAPLRGCGRCPVGRVHACACQTCVSAPNSLARPPCKSVCLLLTPTSANLRCTRIARPCSQRTFTKM